MFDCHSGLVALPAWAAFVMASGGLLLDLPWEWRVMRRLYGALIIGGVVMFLLYLAHDIRWCLF